MARGHTGGIMDNFEIEILDTLRRHGYCGDKDPVEVSIKMDGCGSAQVDIFYE